MYDGDRGEIDFGSSQREVRVREGSSYWIRRSVGLAGRGSGNVSGRYVN